MGLRNEQLRWQLAKGLVQTLHLERLASRYSRTTVMAVFNLINGGLSIALVSFVALVTQEAFIFPSLGATLSSCSTSHSPSPLPRGTRFAGI